eukprot:SAG11_NODE_2203_length_3670_cov_62.164395_6_plen_90_part_00
MMTFGMLPSRAMTRSLLTVSSLPTTSVMSFGLYFSTQGRSAAPDFALAGGAETAIGVAASLPAAALPAAALWVGTSLIMSAIWCATDSR